MLENLWAQLKQDAKARFRVLRTTLTGGAVSSDASAPELAAAPAESDKDAMPVYVPTDGDIAVASFEDKAGQQEAEAIIQEKVAVSSFSGGIRGPRPRAPASGRRGLTGARKYSRCTTPTRNLRSWRRIPGM